jgi:chromosome segregation ATPase
MAGLNSAKRVIDEAMEQIRFLLALEPRAVASVTDEPDALAKLNKFVCLVTEQLQHADLHKKCSGQDEQLAEWKGRLEHCQRQIRKFGKESVSRAEYERALAAQKAEMEEQRERDIEKLRSENERLEREIANCKWQGNAEREKESRKGLKRIREEERLRSQVRDLDEENDRLRTEVEELRFALEERIARECQETRELRRRISHLERTQEELRARRDGESKVKFNRTEQRMPVLELPHPCGASGFDVRRLRERFDSLEDAIDDLHNTIVRPRRAARS